MVWTGLGDDFFKDTMQNLLTKLFPSFAMMVGRNESQSDKTLGQLCALMMQTLECSLTSTPLKRRKMTPAGLASLLLGIASTLIFIGSTAFMIGMMMMPLVAMVATALCFVGMVTNLFHPGMWPWRRSHQLHHKRDDDFMIQQPS